MMTSESLPVAEPVTEPAPDHIRFSASTQWIWDDGEPSPRNGWRQFRRTFALDDTAICASLTITADTRYVAFVNGTRVGHGPVRGFPHRWFVDRWEIGHLLHAGRPNTVAIHVLHFGLSTFADHRKRGGLLAEITTESANGRRKIGTDATWRVDTPAWYEPRANRLSCQLGFTEQIDARRSQGDWTAPDFDDAAWKSATIVAAPGDGPWTTLVPRDIPALAETVVRPNSLARLAFVRPSPVSAAIDLRVQFSPESADHANHIAYRGYLVTCLRVATATTATLILPGPAFRDLGIAIDGHWFPRESLVPGPQDSMSLGIDLAAGDHLVVIDVSARDHGHTFSLLVDATDPSSISLASPVAADAATPFATLGPLTGIAVGRVEEIFPSVPPAPAEVTRRIRHATSAGDLSAVAELRAVPAHLVSPVSLYGIAVHPGERGEVPVPAAMQAIAAGNAIPIPVRQDRDTELILDMGREFAGYITIDIEAPAGTIVDVYGFEYLKGDHREDTPGLDNCLRYITREGRQRYTSPTRRGFRWLQVTIRNASPDADILLHDVAAIESHFPVSRTGSFRASDARLNEIWEMSRRTVIACMEDTYVDCPAYEQVFWVGDSYSSSRFAAYLFGAEALTERCLRLVPGSLPQSPLYGSNVPSGWDSVIPNFTFFWVQAAREHWFRTGNDQFAREIWPSVAATLNAYLDHLNADGLLDIDAWNLLDWAPIDQPDSGVVAHQNCLFVLALEAANQLAIAAGEETAGAAFVARASDLRKAIDTILWSDEANAYIDAIHRDGRRSTTISVQTQMFALLAGVPQGARKERIESAMVAPPADWVQIGSPWMSIFLYDVLAERGHTATALADARRNYGMMLDHGATTCWEVFPTSPVAGRGILTRSHCHAWSAAPAAFFPARLLGIRPVSPGWKKVLVAPEPCGLDSAEGAVPLPQAGSIAVAWRIADGAMELTVTAPESVELDIRLPDGMPGEVVVRRI